MVPILARNVDRTASPPIAAAASWKKLFCETSDRPLLDLAQAVPNYPPAPELLEALADGVRDPATAFYTPILGLPGLRQAYARSVSGQYDTEIDQETVAITAGGNHAFCMAVMALAGAGETVMLAQPHYFNHDMWFSMLGINVIPLPCRPSDRGMLPDADEAAALIAPNTRAIVLVSPNNPTGTIYPPSVLRSFLNLARERGLALILDETYKDFIPNDAPPHDLFEDTDAAENLVHLFSFSKSYSLTGYRVGAMIAARRVIAAVEKVADTITICPPHIGQLAALRALEFLDDWRDAQTGHMASLADALDRAFAKHRPPFELVSRGAFFAYLRHPYDGLDAETVARRIVAEAGLLMLPGSFFGAEQDRYLRLAFANVDTDALDMTAARLAALKI